MLTRRQIIKGTLPMALATAGVCVNIHAGAEPQQESLEELLAWAKEHRWQIDFRGDDSVLVLMAIRKDTGSGKWTMTATQAPTLREALEKAKAEIERQAL